MLLVLAVSLATGATPVVVAQYDYFSLQTPESVVADVWGNKYVGLALSGQVSRVDASGAATIFASLPIGAPGVPCGGPLPGLITGLALDPEGNLYVAVNSCEPGKSGVWRVNQAGQSSQLATYPLDTFPGLNGVEWVGGRIFVADSFANVIWEVPTALGPLSVWSADPLLARPPDAFLPGPNGIQFFKGKLYVAVPATNRIVAIPMRGDGLAGEAAVHADVACDDIVFDAFGRIYCATDLFNTLLRVDGNGAVETLLTSADGLDNPTSAAFGRTSADMFDLYVANASFPYFPNNQSPSLMRVHIGAPGAAP